MQLRIGYSEILSLMARSGVNLFFQPIDRRTLRIGLNSFMSMPIAISITGRILNCRYSSGPISGRIVNAVLSLFQGRFGSIRFDLSSPGVVGVELESINAMNKILAVLDITDIHFEGPTCIIDARMR